MILIIGGAFQGKDVYARRISGLGEDAWVDGATCDRNQLFTCGGVFHFHEYIRRSLEVGDDLSTLVDQLLENNPDIIIVTNEIGYGLVPVDSFERKYRETTGRICEQLASEASEVHRVVCGIGTVIKHD